VGPKIPVVADKKQYSQRGTTSQEQLAYALFPLSCR
jgi:hypothetical protein